MAQRTTPSAGETALAAGQATAMVVFTNNDVYVEIFDGDAIRPAQFCKALMQIVIGVARDHDLDTAAIRAAGIELDKPVPYDTPEET